MTPAQEDWERCKAWIAAALVHARGTHELEDVESGIADGTYQFWPGKNAAIVSEIIQYPRLRALNFWLIGGDLNELKDMEPSITDWAKAAGCSRVMGVGRKGFERAFTNHGFTLWWTCIAKEI